MRHLTATRKSYLDKKRVFLPSTVTNRQISQPTLLHLKRLHIDSTKTHVSEVASQALGLFIELVVIMT